jgi:hypothetical protein
MFVDEINDNIPCPECGQDQCVCDPDDGYISDYDDFDDEEESEDEEIQ